MTHLTPFFLNESVKKIWNGLILAGFNSMSQIMDFTTDSYSLTNRKSIFNL